MVETSAIWVLVGEPGCGKTSIFNYFTQKERVTGNSMLSLTDSKQMHDDILQPVRATAVNAPHLRLCDSEGLGATSQNSNGNQALEKFFDNFRMVTSRMLAGGSGVVFCIPAETRINAVHEMMMKSIMKTLGNISVVICVTKSDKFDGDDMNEKTEAAQEWIAENKLKVLKVFDLKEENTTFVTTSINDKKKRYHVDELLAVIDRPGFSNTPQIEKRQKKFQIEESVELSVETGKRCDHASMKAAEEVQLMVWFQRGAMTVFGVVAGVVALPFAILGALAYGAGMVSDTLFDTKFTDD
jgi:GTP-binding protein EngB required for normal cell division